MFFFLLGFQHWWIHSRYYEVSYDMSYLRKSYQNDEVPTFEVGDLTNLVLKEPCMLKLPVISL